ncbi:MAG: arginine--tRNA ligase, partial [Muribaculaceae bacterium]|nr:arginine--tRNA ligase [Muribaculaceae bacterium]
MTIESIISGAVAKALKALYGAEFDAAGIVPQATRKEFEGNLTIVVFPYLKVSHKSPEATATEIGEWLVANEPAVSKFNVVKGFLNISINPSFWLGVLHEIAKDPDYGITKVNDDSELVMVEYSSPNTNKPLHLG